MLSASSPVAELLLVEPLDNRSEDVDVTNHKIGDTPALTGEEYFFGDLFNRASQHIWHGEYSGENQAFMLRAEGFYGRLPSIRDLGKLHEGIHFDLGKAGARTLPYLVDLLVKPFRTPAHSVVMAVGEGGAKAL